jgi:hypothetical protein
MSDNYDLGKDHVSVNTATVVSLKEYFVVNTMDGPIDIIVDIKADFESIPKEYHEICLNVLTSKYLNKVDFSTNSFSECKFVKKRRWFQFWKSPYFLTKINKQ